MIGVVHAGADFRHLVEVHGWRFPGYESGDRALHRHHLFAHGLGPDPAKSVTV